MSEPVSEPCLPARLWLRLADFAHPADVAADAELSPEEKRQILACWASDAHVPDSRPALRWLPGTPGPVPLRSVLAALDGLDHPAATPGAVIAAFAAGRRGQARNARILPG
jgi:hypothetical protein